MDNNKKRLVFLSGTRADYGKLKPILKLIAADSKLDLYLFITGMHMLTKYGSTFLEVFYDGYEKVYTCVNQNHSDTMDVVLAKTISGFSDFVKEIKPDLIVVHGDRVEALAGATVGSLNNILVAHIEGGEVSGTVDELMRHATSKLSHLHFVSNEQARNRLLHMGERAESIFVIGSPEIDVMASNDLPSFEDVALKYNIHFARDNYGIAIFHPVTTEIEQLRSNAQFYVEALIASKKNYVVIYPNNDLGEEYISESYQGLKDTCHFLLYPSMRFEHFLTLMKNARFIVGNSSVGVREAPFYGIPSVNIGTRQHNRSKAASILHCGYSPAEILVAIKQAGQLSRHPLDLSFGDGKSSQRFLNILHQRKIWQHSTQKYFSDFLEKALVEQ